MITGEDELVMPTVAMRMRGGRKEGRKEDEAERSHRDSVLSDPTCPACSSGCHRIEWSPGPLARSILQTHGNLAPEFNKAPNCHRSWLAALPRHWEIAVHPLPAPERLLAQHPTSSPCVSRMQTREPSNATVTAIASLTIKFLS